MKTARLLTVGELADALHLHPQTVYAWTGTGRLPFLRLNGRIRFDPAAVDRMIVEGKFLPSPLPSLPKLDLSFSAYDKLFLEGAKALSKNSGRWNYGIGSISLRRTKKGFDRWYLDYRSKEGERRREVAKNTRTRGDAITALQARVAREFNREFKGGGLNEAEQLTFNEFAERYLSDYAEKTKKSAVTDRYRLRSIREAFKGFRLPEITKTMILEFREKRLQSGIARASTNREIMLLSKMFNWAVEQGYCSGNPTRGIKKFSETDTIRNRILSGDEERRLMEEIAPHVRPIVLIALHSGLRYREVLGLMWKNLDLEKRILKVEGRKSGKARFIPINSVLQGILGKLRGARGDSARVFPFKNVRTAFENACLRAGIEDLCFHDLRRTFGTRLLERGADVVTISRLYGHSNVIVTQRYLHPNDLRSGEAVESLASGPENSAVRPGDLSNAGQTARREEQSIPRNLFFSVN